MFIPCESNCSDPALPEFEAIGFNIHGQGWFRFKPFQFVPDFIQGLGITCRMHDIRTRLHIVARQIFFQVTEGNVHFFGGLRVVFGCLVIRRIEDGKDVLIIFNFRWYGTAEEIGGRFYLFGQVFKIIGVGNKNGLNAYLLGRMQDCL